MTTQRNDEMPDELEDIIRGVENYLNCYCKTWNISFQKIVDRLRTEITMHKAWEKRAYQAEKELNDFRAASTPSVPVDTIAVPREVLQWVRVLLEGIAKRPDLPNPERDADWKNCQKWSAHDAQQAIASLDAVLEGE